MSILIKIIILVNLNKKYIIINLYFDFCFKHFGKKIEDGSPYLQKYQGKRILFHTDSRSKKLDPQVQAMNLDLFRKYIVDS